MLKKNFKLLYVIIRICKEKKGGTISAALHPLSFKELTLFLGLVSSVKFNLINLEHHPGHVMGSRSESRIGSSEPGTS